MCQGCLCKPQVLAANDSCPYSPFPDWWWQKGRYSSACVTQLLWLLLPKALQLDKEMNPNKRMTQWQQRAWKWVYTLCCCPSNFPFPFCNYCFFKLVLWYLHFLWPSVSELKKSMKVCHQFKRKKPKGVGGGGETQQKQLDVNKIKASDHWCLEERWITIIHKWCLA